mmetsp:Transcript_29424/g.43438  ORF Transcript_29424/g.43438 Transcript_29424/m.43438 type:complete len:155 (+) Transcript_29424:385-849(+)
MRVRLRPKITISFKGRSTVLRTGLECDVVLSLFSLLCLATSSGSVSGSISMANNRPENRATKLKTVAYKWFLMRAVINGPMENPAKKAPMNNPKEAARCLSGKISDNDENATEEKLTMVVQVSKAKYHVGLIDVSTCITISSRGDNDSKSIDII